MNVAAIVFPFHYIKTRRFFKGEKFSEPMKICIKIDVDPSKEQRGISDVVLKNESPMVQTCRNINVHVVNTDIS